MERVPNEPKPGEMHIRRGMRIGMIEGLFASASDHLASPFVSLYALLLGASHTQIGLVTAVPALIGTSLQLPAAWMAEQLARRKLLAVIGGAGARGLWFLVAIIPFLSVGPSGAVALLILLLSIRSAFGALLTPTWTSLIAEVTPKGMRGAYFANRSTLVTAAAIIATLMSGAILKLFSVPLGYQLVFGLAAMSGFIASASFSRFPDMDSEIRESTRLPKDVRTHGGVTERQQSKFTARMQARRLVNVFRERQQFTTYAAISVVWSLGVNLPAPLFSVHFVEGLGGTAGFWGVVTGATFVTTFLGQRYWGPLTDRFGGRNVMVTAGIFAAIIPGLWLLSFRPEHGIWINLVSGFGWAGYNLASFNLLLDMTPDNRRSMYVAAYNGIIGISQFSGPLIGGILADLVSVKFVFASSTVLRFVGLGLILKLIQSTFERPLTIKDFLPQVDVKLVWTFVIGLPSAVVRYVSLTRQKAALRQKRAAYARISPQEETYNQASSDSNESSSG